MKKTILLVLVLAFGLVTEQTNANFTFGTPTNLGPLVNSPYSDLSACVSADGLSLFFSSNRSPGGFRDFDLWMATRQAKNEDWGVPVHLGDTLNSRGMEWNPCISSDGLELYFAKGTWGDTDIVVARRDSVWEPWGAAESLGLIVNSTGWDAGPSISADGLELFFLSIRPGGYGGPDLYATKRATTADAWGLPANLGPTVNSSYGDSLYGEWTPSISWDGLTLFFASARPPGSATNLDIWMTRRATREDEWEPPVHLGHPIDSPYMDSSPCISSDGRMLYFVSARPVGIGGDSDFWQVPIIPIVDFNGDGIVDAADMCIMVDHWGENYPLCDIGPTPLGDGIVDVQDLIVLAEHLFEEIFPPGLVAYLKLDEAEGSIAHDSIGDNHGTVYGEPLWQPESGKKDGALAFDGIDDYVETGFVLDPAGGDFSVLAWMQGGAPGQVILSQTDGPSGAGEIWLGTDSVEGKLMTKLLSPSGRSPAPPMVADAVITDGQWHHIGIVVTEQKVRDLYVDGIRVAFDNQPIVLPSSDGGLYIGVNKILDATSFFSGMIDDIRIYNRALSADEIAALAR